MTPAVGDWLVEEGNRRYGTSRIGPRLIRVTGFSEKPTRNGLAPHVDFEFVDGLVGSWPAAYVARRCHPATDAELAELGGPTPATSQEPPSDWRTV